MRELMAQIVVTLRSMWRRRWIGLAVAWTVGLAGALGLLRLADRYEASARVFVDTKSVLKPLMRDLAVEPDLDQTINLLARTIITRPNIERLIGKEHLALEFPSPDEREKAIEKFLRDIKLTASGRDNVFSFSYRDTDSVKARRVVERLVALFVESDLGAKARDSESARDFIDQQVKQYEARLAEAEGRLKDFKVRNIGLADSTGKDYFSRMSALSEELAKINVELRAAEQSREVLKRELSGETASLIPEPSAPIEVASPELDARLDTQRRQLDDLLRRYTDLHPDVVATKRLIASLEEQKQREIEARQRAALAKPAKPAADNRTQPIKLALAESEATVASLRVRAGDLQSRVNQLRSAATRVPQVEAELAQLNRDYEVIRRNYETMVGRREKASLSEDIEATRLANFRVIDPPRSAPRAVFPNRLSLAPLILLLSLAAGAAASFLAGQILPTVSSAAALRSLTQRPVLGSVSALVTSASTRRRRLQTAAFGSAGLSLMMLYGGWIAWMMKAVSA